MGNDSDLPDAPGIEVRPLSNELPYPPEFTRAFGEMMLEFAALEGDLLEATIDLATSEYFIGAIILAGVPYAGLVARFCAVALHFARENKPIVDEVDALRLALLAVSERRNRLVHSQWFLEPQSGDVSRIKASVKGKTGLRFDTPIVPVSEVCDLFRDTRQIRGQVRGVGSTVFELSGRKRSQLPAG